MAKVSMMESMGVRFAMGKSCRRFGILIALVAACGCGSSGPELTGVTGTVTLDGEIVEGAVVQFIPQKQGGSTSFGQTDKKGHYEMAFTSTALGVLPGKSKVRISSDDRMVVGGKKFGGVEIFPANYNKYSDQFVEVGSGSNEFNFDIKSNEATRKAMEPRQKQRKSLKDLDRDQF